MSAAIGGDSLDPSTECAGDYAKQLEHATQGLLELNVAVLEHMEKTIDLGLLRALQSLERLGPIMVTELGNDLDMLVSTASRLSDRLADAGLITRRVSPANRRATLLDLTDGGRNVLNELINIRTSALARVTELMTEDQRHALLTGTRAFTIAQRQLGSLTD
jgi:DNA-binding MarR family transcriptional regulator